MQTVINIGTSAIHNMEIVQQDVVNHNLQNTLTN